MRNGLIVDKYGTKEWFLDGKRHREDGPAIECADGAKFWYRNGKPHREDGPAVEVAEWSREWWFNGTKLYVNTLKEFRKQIKLMEIQEVMDA
jgi:hypothetical protein